MQGFIEDPNNPPEIWGHELMKSLTMEGAGIGPRRLRGSVQQFGSAIRWQQTGTGIYTHQALKYPVPPIFPDKLISADETKVTIGGLNLTFIYIPGESKDQVGIWLEERRVLLPADKIYRMYPNVYAIRGQPARDPNECERELRNAGRWTECIEGVLQRKYWCASLAKLRSLKADYLVPSHFLPLEGAQRIYDHLTIYMSGMQFVHDQTVRYMNKGLHPDDTAQRIKLPQSLANHQYMQQVYGNVIWTSKGVYEQYVGWFNGDPVDLFPHTPLERGRRMIDLVGLSQLLSRAELALKDDPQWALELASYVTTVHPDNSLARAIRGRAIRALAGAQTNHLARNFYLTAALDNHGLVDYSVNMTGIIDNIDMGSLLNILKVRVNADLTDGVNMTVVFHFSDTKETFQLLMLYSVLYITPLADTDHLGDTYDAKITTTTQVWKDINLKRLTPVSAAESGALKIDGSLTSFRQFLSFFET